MNLFSDISAMCIEQVRKGGEETMLAICNCAIPARVMLFEYDRLERKMDNLPREEITSIWEYVCSRFPDKTREERITAAKIIHCFGELL